MKDTTFAETNTTFYQNAYLYFGLAFLVMVAGFSRPIFKN